MRPSAAARRYARALFSLASESGNAEGVQHELDAMGELLDRNPQLAASLFRPLHPVASRRALLEAICERLGTSALLRSFYSLLIDQRRLVDFPAIRVEFGRLADGAAGLTHARVVAASPLSDSQRERLQRALSTRTGRDVKLEVTVDPALLGGAVATVGGLVFDGSLRTQLSQLRATLTRGH